MAQVIEITDFSAPELDVYARLTEAQLLNRFEPARGMFIAESPKVIHRALDGGCQPVSMLMERKDIDGSAREILANAQKLGVPADFYKTKDIHVHFPEGAVPKDGPSAGVTVCTAIVSALTNTTVRRDVAMTGEVSLRGRVMRIGGLKEKTMAALRHGIRTVIIPKDNERDLEEIDQTVRKQLNFISASTVDTVLNAALNRTAEMNPAILGSLPEDVSAKARRPELQQ